MPSLLVVRLHPKYQWRESQSRCGRLSVPENDQLSSHCSIEALLRDFLVTCLPQRPFTYMLQLEGLAVAYCCLV